MKFVVKLLPGEYWYGLHSTCGRKMPVKAGMDFEDDCRIDITGNQSAPLLLSSKGRYVWCDNGFAVKLCGDVFLFEADSEIELRGGYENLRGAFRAASDAHFPGNGQLPPKNFFLKPQYNTWVELIYDQNQEDVIKYAHNILKAGLPAGILMIDDNWNRCYGDWEFRKEKFPDPAAMVRELHDLGFEVMLWTCPFISPDTANFRLLRDKGGLVREPDGEVAVRKWWNGYSAVLDMTNPVDRQWYWEQNHRLMDEYGIDGFKFDAGDSIFYRDDDKTYAPVTPNGQCRLWSEMGKDYPYNEYRASWNAAGLPLVQRLCDKSHRWDTGVVVLIPDCLSQGILGYAFNCPDMIGGGSFVDFLPGAKALDPELFVRYAQCAALLPMMQYSAAPWRVLDAEHAGYCVEAGKLHLKYAEKIYALAENAATTCEPIVRYLEYVFPGEGLEAVNDQFMLGDDLLVAPVTVKGQYQREVRLPGGKWRYVDGTVYDGGATVTVDAPISVLPHFEKVD
ncbi:MAG: glycoside hydrolase [Ruminococcaceae bacterium]|nr:glycoside hydrolase [Oscillospiraceae bacterium]